MLKKNLLQKIQKRLPDDIIIEDETKFNISDDEFIGVLSWIKYFCEHYSEFEKNKSCSVEFPLVSKRLHIDFGLYRIPCNIDKNRGKHIVYLCENDNRRTTADLVKIWNL